MAFFFYCSEKEELSGITGVAVGLKPVIYNKQKENRPSLVIFIQKELPKELLDYLAQKIIKTIETIDENSKLVCEEKDRHWLMFSCHQLDLKVEPCSGRGRNCRKELPPNDEGNLSPVHITEKNDSHSI